MKRHHKIDIKCLGRSFIAGWVSLVVSLAIDFFLIPHRVAYTSEVGLFGAYIFFGGIFSLYFIADFLLFVVPSHLILINTKPPIQRWLWVSLGALLFVFSVPCWSIMSNHIVKSDIIYSSGLAAICGLASYYVMLRRCVDRERHF